MHWVDYILNPHKVYILVSVGELGNISLLGVQKFFFLLYFYSYSIVLSLFLLYICPLPNEVAQFSNPLEKKNERERE